MCAAVRLCFAGHMTHSPCRALPLNALVPGSRRAGLGGSGKLGARPSPGRGPSQPRGHARPSARLVPLRPGKLICGQLPQLYGTLATAARMSTGNHRCHRPLARAVVRTRRGLPHRRRNSNTRVRPRMGTARTYLYSHAQVTPPPCQTDAEKRQSSVAASPVGCEVAWDVFCCKVTTTQHRAGRSVVPQVPVPPDPVFLSLAPELQ